MSQVNPWGYSSEWRDGIPPEIHPGDAEVLLHLVRQVRHPGMVVVEVGSWVGNGSTRVITEAVRGSGVVYCVDTWAGSDNVEHHRTFRRRYDSLFPIFAENVRAYAGQDVVRPLQLSSVEASRRFPDGSLDLVFIDANHGYSHVKRDVLAWLPKVKPGGVLCGHDCEVSYLDLSVGLRTAIEPYCEEDYFKNELLPGPPAFHAGVVKAVHELFGPRAILWARSMQSTIWSVRTGGFLGRVRNYLRKRSARWWNAHPAPPRWLPAATPWPAAHECAAEQPGPEAVVTS